MVILSTGNILTSEVTTGNTDFSSVILCFSNNLLKRFYIKYCALMDNSPPPKGKVPFITYSQDNFMRQYANSLVTLLGSSTSLTPEMKQVKLEELLLYLVQVDCKRLQSLQIMSKDYVDLNLQKLVESHIGQPITIEELAFLCNMSASTFKRNFNRIYGTSPQQYLLGRKLKMAALLLECPSETPSAVYLKVGYKNHSSFSGAFREYFGINPSEYHLQHCV